MGRIEKGVDVAVSNFELVYTEIPGIRSRIQRVGANLTDCASRLRRQASVLSNQHGFGVEEMRDYIHTLAVSVSAHSGDVYKLAAFLSDLERIVTAFENQAHSILSAVNPDDKEASGSVAIPTTPTIPPGDDGQKSDMKPGMPPVVICPPEPVIIDEFPDPAFRTLAPLNFTSNTLAPLSSGTATPATDWGNTWIQQIKAS